jgi:cysteine desulfurase
VRLEPQITGGGQQEGRRSGTLNVPGIVGFAKALQLCVDEMPIESPRLTKLRDELARDISVRVPGVQICGPALDLTYAGVSPLRLPNNLNLSFGNVDGEALLLAMGNLAVSSGAACTSTDTGPSHVLLAIGLSEEAARSSLRFGLGRFNSSADIEYAAERVSTAVIELRHLTSWQSPAKTG